MFPCTTRLEARGFQPLDRRKATALLLGDMICVMSCIPPIVTTPLGQSHHHLGHKPAQRAVLQQTQMDKWLLIVPEPRIYCPWHLAPFKVIELIDDVSRELLDMIERRGGLHPRALSFGRGSGFSRAKTISEAKPKIWRRPSSPSC